MLRSNSTVRSINSAGLTVTSKMDLELPSISERYTSASQISRIATESWTERYVYCPSCGLDLTSYKQGMRVYDFYSSNCNEKFQLKSAAHPFSGGILGFEYQTTLNSILMDKQPSFILPHYNRQRWMVEDLSLIHRACVTTSCIIARRPLAATARRAGWQGCIISLNQIPRLGQIEVITKGVEREKSLVLEQWKKSETLLKAEPEYRGWLADILRCVEKCFSTFSLTNMYQFEAELAVKHPNNRNIRAKIRQQLQVLRDLGLVEFVSPGIYRYLGKQIK